MTFLKEVPLWTWGQFTALTEICFCENSDQEMLGSYVFRIAQIKPVQMTFLLLSRLSL